MKSPILWYVIGFALGVAVGVMSTRYYRQPISESDSWPTQALPSDDMVEAEIMSAAPAAQAELKYVPTRRLTPGDIFPNVTLEMLKEHGYTDRVRNVNQGEKKAVLNRYHLDYKESPTGQLIDTKTNKPFSEEIEFDHLVSLELGGSNAVENIWPEPYATANGARTKDKLENRLHKLVVEGTVSLEDAQKAIAKDWEAAFAKYCPDLEPSAETVGEGQP